MAYPFEGKDPTPFSEIYDAFFAKITDDMYMEWTKEDTERDLLNILLDAIPNFEFPRFPLYDYTITRTQVRNDETGLLEEVATGTYNCYLSPEEVNILALCMLNTWVQRQTTSIENTRQKYSGSSLALLSRKRVV